MMQAEVEGTLVYTPSPSPNDQSKETKKYQMMTTKNEFIHTNFPDLPGSEKVIQNYRCKYYLRNQTFGGKMWMTHNYVLFTSFDSQQKEKIPFSSISAIDHEAGLLSISSTVSFILYSGMSMIFSGFFHRDETLTLLNYLLHHSPCYYLIPKTLEEKMNKSLPPPGGQEKKNFFEANSRWSQLEASPLPAELYERPDVSLAEQTAQLADDIYGKNLQICSNLEDDARAIDRIQRNMEETDYYVNKGKLEVAAIGSLGGQVKKTVVSLFSSELGAYDAPDRSAGSQEAEFFYDVPIVVKHPNCDLQKAVLRFGKDEFSCVDYPSNENQSEFPLIRNYKFSYTNVQGVILRVRPLHLDIRFEDNSARFRCISSFVQMIVNEIFIRTNRRVSPLYEPGTRQFEYGNVKLREYPLQSSRDASSKLFQRQAIKTADIVVNESTPEVVKNDLQEVDELLDHISKRVSCIEVTVADIGLETKRQTEQAKNINQSTNVTFQTMHRQEYEVRKLL